MISFFYGFVQFEIYLLPKFETHCTTENMKGAIYNTMNFPELSCHLYVPVNSYGHVGASHPFYRTLTQYKDVMTSKCAKNITAQLNVSDLFRYYGWFIMIKHFS